MITFNGKRFAKDQREFTETLFSRDGTAFGFYKVKRPRNGKGGGVWLYDHQMNLFAFIAVSGRDCFIVSASEVKGTKRYMFSTSSLTDKLLGLHELGYRACSEECERVCGELGLGPVK